MTRSTTRKTALAVVTTGLLAFSFASNADVITGVTAEYTSPNADFNSITFSSVANYNANAVVNGAGLAGDTHTNTFGSTMLHDNNISEGTIVFDLGAVYDLASVNLWNYNSAGTINRGLLQVTVEVSENGSDYTGAGTLSFAQANNPNTPAQNVAFSATDTRFIRFTNMTLHSGVIGGFSEIQFVQVPEPGSLALIAFGGLAMARRRRR